MKLKQLIIINEKEKKEEKLYYLLLSTKVNQSTLNKNNENDFLHKFHPNLHFK